MEIDEEKIIVKGIFGTLTECKISEIKEVSIRFFQKEGSFFVIYDGRELKRPFNFTQKNCKIRFKHSAKREELIRILWTGEMKRIDLKDG